MLGANASGVGGRDAAGADHRVRSSIDVRRGFVLFVPHRRGHGKSSDAGTYMGRAAGPETVVGALVAQTDDVMSAVAYVAALPYVEPTKVVVSGCSYGGIEALFAAERGTGIVAAIDFAVARACGRERRSSKSA